MAAFRLCEREWFDYEYGFGSCWRCQGRLKTVLPVAPVHSEVGRRPDYRLPIPRTAHQNASVGSTSHCATGDRPALITGMTGIRSR